MMKNDYSQKEEKCIQCFSRVKPCYHLWTPEKFEIIFRNDAEFRFGMGIIAIAAKCFPEVRILTFELMSNHLHILAVGDESKLKLMFEQIKKYLRRMAEDAGRTMDWSTFTPRIRLMESLSDARNVLS